MGQGPDDIIRALLAGLSIDEALPADRVAPLEPGPNRARLRTGTRPFPEGKGEQTRDADCPFPRREGGRRGLGPTAPHADLAWCQEAFAEYQARWPDRDREAGRRYLGSLPLREDEGRQLIDRVAYVVRAHAPISVPRFRKLAGSPAVWDAWAAIFTLAVVEFAYRWEPDDDDVRGFWGACLRRLGDSLPDGINHHSAARAILASGFEVWGLRRAPEDTYRYVTTVMLQTGIPRRFVPAFRRLIEAIREEHGWDRLARESPSEVARRIGVVGRRSWPTSGLRHLIGGERGWDSPNEAAGELVCGLARLVRFCEGAGKGVDELTDVELQDAIHAGAASLVYFRDWRHVAEMLRPGSPSAARRERPWLAWSPDEGVVCVFPRQTVELEEAEAVALVLRVGGAILARRAVVPTGRGPVYLPDLQCRLSRIDGPIVWELMDEIDQPIDRWAVPGVGEDGCALLVLDPRRETLQIEPQRLRDTPEIALLAPRSCLAEARWPDGTKVAPFAGAVGIDGWTAVRIRREIDEVVLPIGKRRLAWYASSTEPQLYGWRATPGAAATPSFLEPPRLWLPAHLAHTDVLVEGQPITPDLPREAHPDGSASISLAAAGRADVAAAGRFVALRWQVDSPPAISPPGPPRWRLLDGGREHTDRSGVWLGDLRELVQADLRVEGLWPGDVFDVAVCGAAGEELRHVEVVADRDGRAELGLIALAGSLRPPSGPRPSAVVLRGATWSGCCLIAVGAPLAAPDGSGQWTEGGKQKAESSEQWAAGSLTGFGSYRTNSLPRAPTADGYAPPALVEATVRLASAWAADGRPAAVRRGTLAAAVQDAFPPPAAPGEEEALAAIDVAIERGELRVVPDGYVAAARPAVFLAASGTGFATGHRSLAGWLAEHELSGWRDGQAGDPPAIGLLDDRARNTLANQVSVVMMDDLIRALPRPGWPREPGRRLDEPYPTLGWEYADPTAAHPTWRPVTPVTRHPAACVLRRRDGNRVTYRWWENDALWAPDPADLARIRWLLQTLSGHARILAVPADLSPAAPGWYHLSCPYWLPEEHWRLLRRFTYPALDRGRLVAPQQTGIVRGIFASLGASI